MEKKLQNHPLFLIWGSKLGILGVSWRAGKYSIDHHHLDKAKPKTAKAEKPPIQTPLPCLA